MDEYVNIRLKRDHLGQLIDSLDVQIEQWTATRDYLLDESSVTDVIIRECHKPEDAQWCVDFYSEIQDELRRQFPVAGGRSDNE